MLRRLCAIAQMLRHVLPVSWPIRGVRCALFCPKLGLELAYQHTRNTGVLPSQPSASREQQMTTNNMPSLLLALPEDVQRRLLAGCRYEDLFSLAAVCRAFRSAVNDPKFTKVRQSHGFERGVVLVGTRRHYHVDIRSAETRAVKVSITGELELESCGTTTDGRRMFASCWNVTSKKKASIRCLCAGRDLPPVEPLCAPAASHGRGLYGVVCGSTLCRWWF